MAQRTNTYAIRLAVEGGGQVKAELVSVGQSGEQSLKRIESAGERASGGLKGLGRQAELLRAGIRTLGGALIGVKSVGGLGFASGLKKQAQIDELIAFFRARRGKAYRFRFKDWTDYKATGPLLGTGDDVLTQFQLVKHYPSGSVIEVRTITKPVAGTVNVYLDGMLQASGWSVDTTTGLVTFGTAPAMGVEVTADFEFDVPVRFDTDHMAVTIKTYQLHNWQQIPIVELRI
jgi:uncharacterized protein (TIGR02217 family)